jgi:hypothetical protein
MKKLLILTMLTVVSFHLYSQEMSQVEYRPVKTDYLAKSKKQRTAGWILTGTGSAVIGIGLVVSMAQVAEETAIGFGSMLPGGEDLPEQETHTKGGGALLLTGTAMLATGITFLNIAKKNKRKALSMSFINQSSQQLRYNTVMNTSVPSVRLRAQF